MPHRGRFFLFNLSLCLPPYCYYVTLPGKLLQKLNPFSAGCSFLHFFTILPHREHFLSNSPYFHHCLAARKATTPEIESFSIMQNDNRLLFSAHSSAFALFRSVHVYPAFPFVFFYASNIYHYNGFPLVFTVCFSVTYIYARVYKYGLKLFAARESLPSPLLILSASKYIKPIFSLGWIVLHVNVFSQVLQRPQLLSTTVSRLTPRTLDPVTRVWFSFMFFPIPLQSNWSHHRRVHYVAPSAHPHKISAQ